METVHFSVKAGDITQKVMLYCNDNTYYAFLPSYADFSTMIIQYDEKYTLTINGQSYKPGNSCKDLSKDQEYTIIMADGFGIPVCTEKLIVMQAANIPTMSIVLSNGTLEDIHANQETIKTGIVSLIDQDGGVEYAGVFKGIHGRGNSTWQQPKKSYTLEFDIPLDVLGMGAATKWVLLANPMDESGLRNKLVYDTAKDLGLKYAVNSEYIDLYVDNQYLGLYLLTEKVEVAENRVDITNLLLNSQSVNQSNLGNYQKMEKVVDGKIQRGYDIPNNPADISGGYLVQIEHHEGRILNKPSLFQTEDLSFSITSPKYASKEQITYISEYMNQIEVSLRSDDISVIDIDSFTTLYLLQEFFANTDNCSIFFYKETDKIDSKLYAGPVWDFDLSMGNGWGNSNILPNALFRNKNNWFNYLEQNEQFKQMLWNKYRAGITMENICAKLESYKSLINESFVMNKRRWENVKAINDYADINQKRFETLDEHIRRITDFLEQRRQFLDSVWAVDSQQILISFSSYDFGYYYQSYYILAGTPANIVLDPQSKATIGYRFIGWFDEDGNAYVPEKPLTKQVAYTARWEEDPDAVQEEKGWISRFIEGEHRIAKKSLLYAVFYLVVAGFVITDLLHTRKIKRSQNGKE